MIVEPPINEPTQALLGLLHLARRAREAPDLESLGFVMANETRQLLPYRQAAFWRCDPHSGLPGRLSAVSGLPQPNPEAPYSQWLARLFRARLSSPEAEALCPLTADSVPTLADEWAEWLPAYAMWVPIKHGDGPLLGVLLCAAEASWQAHECALANELAASYAHACHALARTPRGGLSRFAALAALRRHRWRWLIVLGVLCLPVQQSALAPAEVVPKDPFLVRAPQDGVIERMLIQPNQPVASGTPLFSLDQTVVNTRHALARKAYDMAQEEYRQSAQTAVTDDKAKLDMALRRGVMEEKGVELAYSAELLGRVQVSAEREGIAVFADVNDWQGKAVTVGERILTLADPAQVELAIELPVGERFDVAPGTAVSLYPNASPFTRFDATVVQVAYSAETTRTGQVAYRLKAQFVPGAPVPRIGMAGTARLAGRRVPLVYFALRRPLTTLRQWLGL